MVTRRAVCECELGAALSRHIGYTTGAYDLDRIAGVTAVFDAKPSLYEIEIMHMLRKEHGKSEKYSRGIIDFSVALGLLERLEQTGGLPRIRLSSIGRSYRASLFLKNEGFRRFILNYAVLEADSDAYSLVLDISDALSHMSVDSDTLQEVFLRRTRELRDERKQWLIDVFPNPILRNRVALHIQWLTVNSGTALKSKPLGKDFARHHVTPLKGWAKQLGHVNEQGLLTRKGQELLSRLRGGRNRYFWIGPSRKCLEVLGVPSLLVREPLGSAWSILRPKIATENFDDDFIAELVEFMQSGFPALRLVQTNQAPLDAVLPFLHFLEEKYGYRVPEEAVLTSVFSQFRNQFALMAKRIGNFGHYQLRRRHGQLP